MTGAGVARIAPAHPGHPRRARRRMSTPREVADALTWSLARQCRPKDVLVVGVATPLAAAAGMLARELLTPDLTIIMAASVNPKTHDVAESLTDPAAAARRAPGTLTQAEILDAIQRGRVTLQFVSPAEVDAEGRINTNRVGDRRLPGALALPDVAVLVGRLVAYRAGHSPRFLVPRVQYVTGRAGGVRAIVTDKAEIALEGAAAPGRAAARRDGAGGARRLRLRADRRPGRTTSRCPTRRASCWTA